MRGLAGLLPLSAAKPSFRHTPQTVHIVRRKSLHRRLNTGGLTNLYDEAQAPALQVRNVSESGIELKDGLVYASACILFGGQSFVWRVPAQPWVEWSSEAFEIFSVVSPKPGQSLLLPFFFCMVDLEVSWLPRTPPLRNWKKSSSPTTFNT
jgi:hypothetical protein